MNMGMVYQSFRKLLSSLVMDNNYVFEIAGLGCGRMDCFVGASTGALKGW